MQGKATPKITSSPIAMEQSVSINNKMININTNANDRSITSPKNVNRETSPSFDSTDINLNSIKRLPGIKNNHIPRTFKRLNRKMINKAIPKNALITTKSDINNIFEAKWKDLNIPKIKTQKDRFRQYCISKCKDGVIAFESAGFGVNVAQEISYAILSGDSVRQLSLSK